MRPDVLEEFLRQPHVGVVATLRRDGMPYTVPVWWLWDGRAFWMVGTTTRVWCRQLLADPRCSLCIEASGPGAGHVGVDGRATAHIPPQDDIWPMARRLAEKYVGRGDPANDERLEAFFTNMRTEPRMLFELVPEDRPNAIRAIDMTVYRGKRADRDYQERTSEGSAG